MIEIGQLYRSEGRIDAPALLSATILGVTTSVLAAAVIWMWELSPIPTLVILTPLIHGLVIGAGAGGADRSAQAAASEADVDRWEPRAGWPAWG